MATVRHLGLFPFCLPDKNPYTQPLEWVGKTFRADLRSATALFWRIKRIKIEASVHWRGWTFDQNANLVEDYNYTTDHQYFAKLFNKQKETDLICPDPSGLQWLDWRAENEGLGEGVGEGDQWTLSGSEKLFEPLWKDEKTYYLGLPFYIVITNPSDQRNSAQIFFGYPPEDDPYWEGITNVSTSDQEVDFGNGIKARTIVAKAELPGPPSIAIASTITSWSIKAVEYWPYDPGDGGGPIYDSATGAQLRPFPD
jgi:hypothetical protein